MGWLRKTISSSDPTSGEAELFRKGLKNLYANYEAAGTPTGVGRYKIEGVVDRLRLVEEGASGIFALTTMTHFMIIGVTMGSPPEFYTT